MNERPQTSGLLPCFPIDLIDRILKSGKAKKNMNKHFYLVCILFAVVLLHQLARLIIFPMLAEQGSLEVMPFFNLVEVWNHGVSFGMMKDLAHSQWLLSGISLSITAIMFFWLQKTEDKISTIALSLIIAGALGNVLDRITLGAVADYLDFHAFGYHWPAFNFTDTAIICGVCLLILASVTQPHNRCNSLTK